MVRNFGVSFLLLIFSACAHSSKVPERVSLSELSSGRNEGAEISVTGYIKPMGERLFLYRSRASAKANDFTSGVDVVTARSARAPVPSVVTDGSCVVVVGRFTAFDDDTVGTGYFRSTVGFIEANRIFLGDCASGQ